MIDLIANPCAGGANGKKMLDVIEKLEEHLKQRGVEYRLHIVEKFKGSKEKTAELIKNGATTIVSVGGDGTLHEILNGFSDFENVNLGIIPCGTGNDFAKSLNLPKDPVDAMDIIIDGEPKYTDFMQMPTVRGINIIGMGIDVEVLKKYSALKKKTKFGYTKSLVKTLLNFEYSDFTANFGDDELKYRSFIACIANGFCYGGGIPICPPAVSDDGVLDFVAVGEMSKLKIVSSFIKLKSGKILSVKQSFHRTMKNIKIIVPQPYTVNVDGELYQNIPFEVQIVSNKLRIFRP